MFLVAKEGRLIRIRAKAIRLRDLQIINLATISLVQIRKIGLLIVGVVIEFNVLFGVKDWQFEIAPVVAVKHLNAGVTLLFGGESFFNGSLLGRDLPQVSVIFLNILH